MLITVLIFVMDFMEWLAHLHFSDKKYARGMLSHLGILHFIIFLFFAVGLNRESVSCCSSSGEFLAKRKALEDSLMMTSLLVFCMPLLCCP